MLLGLLLLAGCSRAKATTLDAVAQAASAAPGKPDAAPRGKAFGDPCVEDKECSGGVCFHKRLKTPDAGKERRGSDDAVEHDGYCSLRCNDDADCPVPPTKGRCGARGMCKRPD